jgi:hypothetical protein
MLGYLRVVARSSRWTWMDAAGTFLEVRDVDARLARFTRRAQPTLLTYYIADALGVAALALVHPGFLALMRSLRCLVDDTLTGRVSGAIIEALGGRFALLPRLDDPNRVRAVYDVIREGGSCAFPVDGGGPYRQVGTGVVGLAASLRATILPITVQVAPSFSLAPQSKVRVPTPRCRIVAAMGDPIAVVRGTDRRATAATLKRTLDVLSDVVPHAL